MTKTIGGNDLIIQFKPVEKKADIQLRPLGVISTVSVEFNYADKAGS